MHEIITLQFGQGSNHLATHFWNTQESYFTYDGEEESIVDHDIHFRPGIGAHGTETFTPRTVIYDLKGGFGSLRKINALYEIDEPDVTQALWNKPAVIQQQTVIGKCAYQQELEQDLAPTSIDSDSVRYWSDYNRVFFHPRSVVQLNDYELGSTSMPFETWGVGEELFKSVDKEIDIMERDLRPFVEEADQMQAIQMISSTDDAWGGFAARYVDQVKDEYGKTAILFWGLEDNHATIQKGKRYIKTSNTARTISEIAPQTTLFIPVSLPTGMLPPYLTLDRDSSWQISALFSVAMESIALSSRLKPRNRSRWSIDQLGTIINTNNHQNIARLRMSLNRSDLLNGSRDSSFAHGVETSAESKDVRVQSQHRSLDDIAIDAGTNVMAFDIDLFPTVIGEYRTRYSKKREHVFSQYENYRYENKSETTDTKQQALVEPVRTLATGSPVITKTIIPLPFPLLDSFPRIVDQANTSLSSLAVCASLTTDTTVASRLKSLQHSVNRSIAVDEREALANSIGELAEAYEDGWDSGSDEDDD